MTGRNVYWKDILRSDKVIDCETHWEVIDRNGVNQGVVYWQGRDARDAHAHLKRIAIQSEKQVDLVP